MIIFRDTILTGHECAERPFLTLLDNCPVDFKKSDGLLSRRGCVAVQAVSTAPVHYVCGPPTFGANTAGLMRLTVV